MRITAHHTLVISDVHLDASPASQGSAARDASLNRLLSLAATECAEGFLEVVFNGDVFDFDAALAGDLGSRATRLGSGAGVRATQILRAHPAFVEAMRFVLSRAHSLIFVPGNHDVQLGYPQVRATIRRIVGTGRVLFRSLFHRTPDGFHIEHGHMYDRLCASPALVLGHNAEIAETIGGVAAAWLPALCPTTDPHAADPFAKGLSGALACSPSSSAEALGFVRAMATVAPMRADLMPMVMASARENCVTWAQVLDHTNHFARPCSFDAAMATGAWRDYARRTAASALDAAKAIASIYNASGVIMGHTHEAFAEYSDGRFFGNTGDWRTVRGPDGAFGAFARIDSDARGSSVSVRRFVPGAGVR